MIPIKILLSLLKIKISNITSFLKKYNKTIAVFILAIFVAIFCLMFNKLKVKDAEIGRLNNNYLYYQELNQNNSENNRILQLTIDDFKQSRDSLINVIRDTQKELKIKDKDLKQTQIQQQVIKIDTTIIVNKKDSFDAVIKPNDLTSIYISKKDSMLNAKVDISNTQILYVMNKKEYRNKYRNWFSRLLHFDFKKDINYKYQIHNSNDLIRIESTRIIEITK